MKELIKEHSFFINHLKSAVPELLLVVNEKCEILGANDELSHSLGKHINDYYFFKDWQSFLKREKDSDKNQINTVKIRVHDKKFNRPKDVLARCFILGPEKQNYWAILDRGELGFFEDKLTQYSKLATLGELTACLAHDIRNPVSVIKMYAAQLHAIVESGEMSKNKLIRVSKALNRGCDSILSIANHLCQFSRPDEQVMHASNLLKILENAKFVLGNKIIKSRAQVTDNFSKFEREDFDLYCHENSLQQVFVNIIGNACDSLSTKKDFDRSVHIEFAKESEGICLKIKDNGPGISPDHIPLLFDSFFSTRPKGEGTGLGLSICKSIIDNHNGRIDVDSVLGQGVTFSVFLKKTP